MGRSAKLHKRVKKTASGKPIANASTSSSSSQPQAAVAQAKKKASLKLKATSSKSGSGKGPVLGGADYVSLMMGGRRKAREEAMKLPASED